MKIRIKAERHNICLWLPTSLLKSRFGYSIIKQAIKNEFEKRNAKAELSGVEVESKKFEMPISREQVVQLYATLRRIIKENGHFNVVDVESTKGEKVFIRI